MFGLEWIAIAAALLFLMGGWAWSRGRTSRASRRRNRQAFRGESQAEQLLNRRGFDLLERQVKGHWTIYIDEEPVEIEVRADLLVEREGLLYIAEVKTGRLAPDPTFPPTRRQLLEYQLAFDVDGVILVDVAASAVIHLDFPCQRDD
ncbi:MAG: hypothetical protein AAFV53_41495 [Myxococcota bacterium]